MNNKAEKNPTIDSGIESVSDVFGQRSMATRLADNHLLENHNSVRKLYFSSKTIGIFNTNDESIAKTSMNLAENYYNLR